MRFRGIVWRVDHDVNTDLIQPVHAIFRPLEEQHRWVFSVNRPGWVDLVSPGDILVAGRNFGMGSGRPAARVLKETGLACLVAESINGLFFRNCVNFGFPALECPGVHGAFAEGDTADVDLERATVQNLRTGERLTGLACPEALLEILRAGGIFPLLETEGFIEPEARPKDAPGLPAGKH